MKIHKKDQLPSASSKTLNIFSNTNNILSVVAAQSEAKEKQFRSQERDPLCCPWINYVVMSFPSAKFLSRALMSSMIGTFSPCSFHLFFILSLRFFVIPIAVRVSGPIPAVLACLWGRAIFFISRKFLEASLIA